MNGKEHRLRAEAWLIEAADVGEEIRQVCRPDLCRPEIRLDAAIMLLGGKTLTAIEALRHLLPVGIDDQLGVIGRSQVETAIELLYLQTETVRPQRKACGPDIVLTPRIKGELFTSHYPIHAHRLFGRLAAEADPELRRSQGVRRDLRLAEHAPFWHCGGATSPLKELEAALGIDAEGLVLLKVSYQHLSAFTHPHPHLNKYLNTSSGPRSGADPDEVIHDSVVVEQSLCGVLQALRYWSQYFDGASVDGLAKKYNELGMASMDSAGSRITSEQP